MKNIFVIGMCLVFAGSAYAQSHIIKDTASTESSSKMEIEDTTAVAEDNVYLFKKEKEMKDYGELGRIQIITRKDIDNSPVQTLSAVLSRAKGFSVISRGPMGSMNELTVWSGNATTSVAVFIDGKRVNSMFNSIYTLDNIPVSLDMIERIEIVEGGDSKRYGEFALNGAVNIITRKASSLADNGGSLEVQGGMLNSYGAAVTGGVKTKKVNVAFNASGSNAEDTDIDNKHTDAKAYVNLSYDAAKWVRIEAAGSFVYNGYNAPLMTRHAENTEYMNTYNFRGDLDFIFPVGQKMDLFTKYSFSNFKQQFDPYDLRDTPIDYPYAEYYLEQVDYTRISQQTLTFGGLYRNKSVDVAFGIDYNSAFLETSELYGELLTYWKQVPGKPYNFYQRYGSRDSWRAYFDMNLKMKKWYLNAGVGFGGSPEYDGVKFSYGGEFGINISNQLKIFAGIDRSFRDANIYELYVFDDLQRGGDALETHITTTWSAGLKYRNKFSQLYATAYTQQNTDPIVNQYYSNSTTNYFLYGNIVANTVPAYGISGKYSINVDKLTKGKLPIKDMFISGTYNYVDDGDTAVRLTNNYMKYKAELGMTIEPVKNVKIDINASHQKRNGQYIQADALGLTDTLYYDWTTLLDARISYEPSNKRFQIYVQGTNLLNEDYYDTSFMKMPSACVLGGIKYNFLAPRKRKK